MTDIALYRKYRPASFDELYGQEEVVSALKGSLEKGSVAHAYLFAGPRGVGKTSTARIFAKELGVAKEDLYELDAASNRKIEHFRELADSIKTLPFKSKHKLYIIDEVHMLTKEAFNAFLKTLEEPPEHVKFILATTELDKVPETIRSRCVVLHFKPASNKDISKALKAVAQKEGFEIGEDALTLISFLAQGSFRDAFGILQKALSASEGNKLTAKDVEKTHNIAPLSSALSLLYALDSKDKEKALGIVKDLELANIDFKIFTDLFVNLLQDVLVVRLGERDSLKEKYTTESLEILKNAAEDKNINSKLIIKLLNLLELYPYMNNKSLIFYLFLSEFFE